MSLPGFIDVTIVIALRAFIALIFFQALLGKIKSMREFAAVVENYKLLPRTAVMPASWLIVLMEAGVVVFMLIDGTMRLSSIVAAALMALFAIAISINLMRGRTDIDCGCYQGGEKQRLSVSLVIRNVCLAVMCLTLFFTGMGTALPAQIFNGLFAGITMYVLYLVAGQIISLAEKAESFKRKVS